MCFIFLILLRFPREKNLAVLITEPPTQYFMSVSVIRGIIPYRPLTWFIIRPN